MYAKLQINIFIIAVTCAIVFAFASSAQAQGLGQCVGGRIAQPDGTPGPYCAPATCPDGSTSCPGTPLCQGSVIVGHSDPSINGQQCVPSPTAGGGLARDGVFGCAASKYQNIGSLTAVSGVYVPVNDAAVTLNTGYLVYKECVLDGVVSAIKNDAVAGLQRSAMRSIQNSRGGNPQYVVSPRNELQDRRLAIVVADLSPEALGSMCAAFRQPVQNTIARAHLRTINAPSGMFTCPLAVGGTGGGGYAEWFAMSLPEGNILGATALAAQKIRDDFAEDERNIRQMWDWSGGFYPAFDTNANPLAQRVLTPGVVIAGALQQLLGAGTNILINAQEIDQINGALQAGLSATLVSDTIRGLSGLTQSQNGQPSYIDRMAAEASANVRAGAVNAALSILGAARAIETQYRDAKEAIANKLTETILSLRSIENQCWDLIIPKVQDYASSQGASITVATTTERFAQKVIDAQIAPLATTTIQQLRASETALALINQLIADVTNSSSAANQRAALERLDAMVANGQLHSATEAQAAVKQKDEAVAALDTLINDSQTGIKVLWGDSSDPNVGWCNVNNQDVIVMWFNKWKN